MVKVADTQCDTDLQAKVCKTQIDGRGAGGGEGGEGGGGSGWWCGTGAGWNVVFDCLPPGVQSRLSAPNLPPRH